MSEPLPPRRGRRRRATDLAPFATEVVALDHTDLDPIARRLPALRDLPPGDARLLPGQLVGLFDLRRQQWRHVQFIADPHQNEKVTAREMVATLPPQSLLLCDLGFFGFAWFDDLTDQGQWYVSRLRQRTSYEVIHTFYAEHETFDGLVWLGAYRADRAKHAVRLVRFRDQGRLQTYLHQCASSFAFLPRLILAIADSLPTIPLNTLLNLSLGCIPDRTQA